MEHGKKKKWQTRWRGRLGSRQVPASKLCIGTCDGYLGLEVALEVARVRPAYCTRMLPLKPLCGAGLWQQGKQRSASKDDIHMDLAGNALSKGAMYLEWSGA